MKRILIPLLVLALLLCGATASAAGNTMMFDKNVNVVFEGETLQTVLIREGELAEGTVTYESNAPKSATVDENGVVTGISKGRVTITAVLKTEKKTYRTQLNVTVARKATSVEVNTEKLPVYAVDDAKIAGLLTATGDAEVDALPVLVIPVRKSFNLQITVMPKDATSRQAVLTSGDENVLRARGGSITGVAAGQTVLTVASNLSPEVNTRFRVLVVQPVSRIAPVASAKTVAVGEQVSLSADVTPADATIPQIIWTSADDRIATVDANGTVTGVKRGNARFSASAADGSGVRASLTLKVVQKAESVSLDHSEITVDVGRSAMLRATVLPKDTDDKNLIWTSSDESVATVNGQGRVTAVSLGSCEITCESKSAAGVKTTATVHVQQPVKKVAFDTVPEVFAGETAKAAWHVEPANATNPSVTLKSSNEKVFTVDTDGTIHGVAQGEAYLNIITNDGSNRQTRARVKVLQHVEGVHMRRKTAYVDVRETASTSAVLEPENASNKNMTWTSADPAIATIKSDKNRVHITGKAVGETVVTGVTEDGGYETSIAVKIGDWDHALQLRSFNWRDKDGAFSLQVRNRSNLHITRITAEIYFYETESGENNPVAVNTKDGSNVVTAVWKKPLDHDETTGRDVWQMVDYKAPENIGSLRGVVTLLSYQIDDDWVKTIRKVNRPSSEW